MRRSTMARAQATPTLTLGIDEAGRGPAIGPLVMAAVALDTGAARTLTRAGLRDSKSYGAGDEARARRAALAAEVQARARFCVVVDVEVDELDARVVRGELNQLEREVAERMIGAAPACTRMIADGKRMFAPLCARVAGLEAYDDGESRHAAVAAASIIAKDERDRQFAAIAARYRAEFGELAGGGYLNPATRAFLDAHRQRYGRLPAETRLTWTRSGTVD